MPFDLAIIGIVIALILLLIFFSAVVLYLAFRIKETFRKETSRGAIIAKIGFLIGILFLAGGMFYFFANTLSNITGPASTPSPSPTTPPSPSPVPSPSPTATPTPAPTPSPTPMPSPTPNVTPSPTLTLSIAYPPSARMNTIITISFTIINPTVSTAHGAAIQADVLFANFEIQSSTHEVVGNVVVIGDAPPGTTIVSLDLLAPNRAGVVTDTVSLLFQEMTTPITQKITISVRGGY